MWHLTTVNFFLNKCFREQQNDEKIELSKWWQERKERLQKIDRS